MIEPTVEPLQTDTQSGYIGYLIQVAADFANEIGVDPVQVAGMVEILFSPVDSWE